MTFFLETERKLKLQKTGTPSPFEYNPSLSNSKNFGHAPFGSTTSLKRLPLKKANNQNPQAKKIDFQQQFFINDVAVQIKAQDSMSSMFKSKSERQMSKLPANYNNPGPGEYEISSRAKAKMEGIQQNRFALFEKGGKPNPPSIPNDHLGYKEDQNNEMKKVKEPARDPPHPGSYNIRTNLQAKCVVPWKIQEFHQKEKEVLPGPGAYEKKPNSLKKVLSSCFTSTSDRFGQIKHIKPEKRPGPGQYNPALPKKPIAFTQSNFTSKTARFQQSKTNPVGPGAYFDNKKKAQSVTNFKKRSYFQQEESQPQKGSIFDVKNKNPGPGQYRTNYGITYQLEKSLLRTHHQSQFPTERRQIFENKEAVTMPGPGTYEFKLQEHSKGTKIHNKTKVINLKEYDDLQTPSPADYNNMNFTIAAKVKQLSSKQALTLTDAKPFNCATERFKHYSNNAHLNSNKPANRSTHFQSTDNAQTIQNSSTKKVKRLIMTTVKVRVPFGISSTKFQQKSARYEGPDFYEKTDKWIKPTFSIKGKIH